MQAQAWPAIATGSHTLISAPTGSGKTLAAFLWGIDRLAADPLPDDDRHTRLVYVSPLKALSYDIERNLRAPLRGIGADIEVAIRTGDTPQRERQAMRRRPPDILITTPESLYLILTSQARDMLERVQWAIVDEIHAIASTKRGSHTALTLERHGAAQRVPAHRPLGDAEPARGGRPVHGRAAAHVHRRRRRRPQAAGPEDPGARRVDGRARAVHRRTSTRSTRSRAARRRGARSGPRSTRRCSSSSGSTGRRSSS